MLFGSKEDVADLQRGRPDFTILIMDKHEFEMMEDKAFVDLLSAIDIKV